MKDNVFYFSHDFHARKDPKCIALIKDFGIAGYGVYWSIVELLYEQGGKIKKFPALFSTIASELKMKEPLLTKQIEAMLHKYELLLHDDEYIWSDAVLRRLEIREEKKRKKQSAGQAGGISSGLSRKNKNETKQNEALLQPPEANEPKERKGKEIKGKERKGNKTDDGDFTKDLRRDDIFFEKVALSWGINWRIFEKMINDFSLFLDSQEKEHKDYPEFKGHFHNWGAGKYQNYKSNTTDKSRNV